MSRRAYFIAGAVPVLPPVRRHLPARIASTSDFGKLATLGLRRAQHRDHGASRLSTVRRLRRGPATLGPRSAQAAQLHRQPPGRASAAGRMEHFNDFVEVGLLRSALWRAVATAGADKRASADDRARTKRVFERARAAARSLRSSNPVAGVRCQRDETERGLRERCSAYYLYRDLRRGWRITSPNLEQCGLLDIDYVSLEPFLCGRKPRWSAKLAPGARAQPRARRALSMICRVLLDFHAPRGSPSG